MYKKEVEISGRKISLISSNVDFLAFEMNHMIYSDIERQLRQNKVKGHVMTQNKIGNVLSFNWELKQ